MFAAPSTAHFLVDEHTEEMKHNLEHFSEIMEDRYSQIPEETRTEDKFLKLASHKGENVSFHYYSENNCT